ncbi:MAG: M3 family oligoendopeptidase [Promethearchaeota archaeon]
MTESKMAWNLRPLVDSTDLKHLKAKMDQLVAEATKLGKDYRGKITSLDAQGLLTLLKRIEKNLLEREPVLKYARLKYSANSLDPAAKQLSDMGRRAEMKIQQETAFAMIEVTQLLTQKPELVDDSTLSEYKHMLEVILRRAPHILSEKEERLIIQKDRFGINSFSRLQQDWLTTRTFKIKIDGKVKEMPYGEITALYEHPDRHLRKESNHVVYTQLGEDEILWASAMRAIFGDHLETCKLRNWPTPLTQSLIENDVDEQTIKALMDTVENHVELYRRYLHLKTRLMKLPKLANYDILAPLPDMPDRQFTWDQARALVLDAYKSFDQEFTDIVEHMFAKRRIDAEVRKGKASGAWCASWLAGNSAFILLSFNGAIGEVFTLAHENGHAVHSVLMSSKQSPLNTDISYGVAETASIFGELLLAEQLIAQAKTKKEKQEILAKILDEFGMTVFQVSARFFFETWLYEATQRGEFLDGETIAKYWTKARDKMYGDTIDWLPEMKWEWTMKVHYFIPRFRYYNWPYVYGQLFVFALYRLYKEQGAVFVPKLKALLSSGSTKSPREMGAELGLDITTPEFWALGMKQAEEFLEELESLTG